MPSTTKQEAMIAAQRAIIIRVTTVATLGLGAMACAASRLANVTGDLLSASILVIAAFVAVISALAPSETRSRH